MNAQGGTGGGRGGRFPRAHSTCRGLTVERGRSSERSGSPRNYDSKVLDSNFSPWRQLALRFPSGGSFQPLRSVPLRSQSIDSSLGLLSEEFLSAVSPFLVNCVTTEKIPSGKLSGANSLVATGGRVTYADHIPSTPSLRNQGFRRVVGKREASRSVGKLHTELHRDRRNASVSIPARFLLSATERED